MAILGYILVAILILGAIVGIVTIASVIGAIAGSLLLILFVIGLIISGLREYWHNRYRRKPR